MNNSIHFTKQNYILILAGLILAVIGYFVMSGGNTEDPTDFSYDIFNTRRITVAPIIILAGYSIVLVGIMKRFVSKDSSSDDELNLNDKEKSSHKRKK